MEEEDLLFDSNCVDGGSLGNSLLAKPAAPSTPITDAATPVRKDLEADS